MKPVNQSDDIDKSNLIKVEEDQFIEEFLPQVVCSNSNCEVVDKQGNAKGYTQFMICNHQRSRK